MGRESSGNRPFEKEKKDNEDDVKDIVDDADILKKDEPKISKISPKT